MMRQREGLKQSGVNFLFGISDEAGENIAYLGQARVRKMGKEYFIGFKNIKGI